MGKRKLVVESEEEEMQEEDEMDDDDEEEENDDGGAKEDNKSTTKNKATGSKLKFGASISSKKVRDICWQDKNIGKLGPDVLFGLTCALEMYLKELSNRIIEDKKESESEAEKITKEEKKGKKQEISKSRKKDWIEYDDIVNTLQKRDFYDNMRHLTETKSGEATIPLKKDGKKKKEVLVSLSSVPSHLLVDEKQSLSVNIKDRLEVVEGEDEDYE